MSGGLLTQEEVEKLVMALMIGQGEATEDQVIQVVKWGNSARQRYALLEGVLSGDIVIKVDTDDEVTFKLTEQGRKKARSGES